MSQNLQLNNYMRAISRLSTCLIRPDKFISNMDIILLKLHPITLNINTFFAREKRLHVSNLVGSSQTLHAYSIYKTFITLPQLHLTKHSLAYNYVILQVSQKLSHISDPCSDYHKWFYQWRLLEKNCCTKGWAIQ